jgi:thiol-disulfide isomerase/thioredoxin
MKIIVFFLFTSFYFLLCQAQETGIITSEKLRPQAGDMNKYFYTPPKKLFIPAKVQALILYRQKGEFFESVIPIQKFNNRHIFTFKIPDSVSALVIGVVNGEVNQSNYNEFSIPPKKKVDNNNGQGFIFYIFNKKGLRSNDEQIALAGLLYYYARYRLDVKVEKKKLLNMYEATYKVYPKLKDETDYLDYLTILYEEKGNEVKAKLLAYADKLLNTKNDESKWLAARQIYRILKMDTEQDLTEEKILQAFPAGELAKQNFWNRYSAKGLEIPQQILTLMNEYAVTFNDTSVKTRDRFYREIISILLKQNQWDSCKYYMQFVNDKNGLAPLHDNIAWKLSGKQLDNNGTNLNFAKDISKQSLQWIEGDIEAHISDNERALYESLVQAKIKYTNTYALILYKLGIYDSAFYYQDKIYQQQEVQLDVGSIERYAAYAQKIKGMEYCKKLIEEKLSEGINSPAMLQQLQTIYQQSGLNQDDFSRIQKENNRLAIEKKQQSIKAKLGSVKAPMFALKNIDGQIVDLASFKGKTVILDFWATWCGPCIASFPQLQRVIHQYRDDTSVIFLFIDTWERKSPQTVKKAVVKIMNENNYSFNVLFDEKSTTVADYKVEGIPAKFIINGKGEIVFMGQTDNLVFEIKQAKNQ